MYVNCYYHKTPNISHTLGNKFVDHSDVVGALPVGNVPSTYSFLTWFQWIGQRQLARRGEKHLSFGATFTRGYTVIAHDFQRLHISKSVLITTAKGHQWQTQLLALDWLLKKRLFSLQENSMIKSMLVNKDFLTWHLISWLQSCQPIRSHDRKSLLTNMDFT